MSINRILQLLLIISLSFSVAIMTGCTPEYEVEVQADPEDAGEIKGEGTYEEGEEVAVEVDQKEGYEFKGWYEDGERVSEAEEYEFEIEGNKKLVAAFTEIINIPDENLEAAIKEELGVDQVTKENIKDLTTLDASNEDISNLEGIEYAVNLEELNLGGNEVTDEGLEYLAEATNLKRLLLMDNKIEDITPLENLTNLEELRLNWNLIKDISPLSELTNLERLQLCRNKITDISPLENLINMEWLTITNTQPAGVEDRTENQITDISALAELENLNILTLNQNQITDISPLEGHDNLTELLLGSNEIQETGSLSGLNSLEVLDLGNNSINEITPLKELTNLEVLRLVENPAYDDTNAINALESQGVNITDGDFLRR